MIMLINILYISFSLLALLILINQYHQKEISLTIKSDQKCNKNTHR